MSLGNHWLALLLTLVMGSFVRADLIAYSTLGNPGFNGQQYSSTGSRDVGHGTDVLADDITPISNAAGLPISEIQIAISQSLTSTPLEARLTLVFWENSALNEPGAVITQNSNPMIFTSDVVQVPNAPSILFATFNPTGFTLPSGSFWVGYLVDNLDNLGGTTGTTESDLTGFFAPIFGEANVGFSDQATLFQTVDAGDAALVDSPAGNIFSQSQSNLALQITVVPEPSTYLLAGLGCLAGLVVRRRRV